MEDMEFFLKDSIIELLLFLNHKDNLNLKITQYHRFLEISQHTFSGMEERIIK